MTKVRSDIKTQSVSAVITRVDGSTYDLGVISFYHKNPIINFFGNLFVTLKRKVRG